MRIRFMNPHAQSKDPCTRTRVSVVAGEFPWNRRLKESKTGKGTSSTQDYSLHEGGVL
jgi:hypothetical protein